MDGRGAPVYLDCGGTAPATTPLLDGAERQEETLSRSAVLWTSRMFLFMKHRKGGDIRVDTLKKSAGWADNAYTTPAATLGGVLV